MSDVLLQTNMAPPATMASMSNGCPANETIGIGPPAGGAALIDHIAGKDELSDSDSDGDGQADDPVHCPIWIAGSSFCFQE